MAKDKQIGYAKWDGEGSSWLDVTCPKCNHEFKTRQYPPGVPEYDESIDDVALCVCGHTYYRHFDPFEEMYPVGCKYCRCYEFKAAVDVD